MADKKYMLISLSTAVMTELVLSGLLNTDEPGVQGPIGEQGPEGVVLDWVHDEPNGSPRDAS